MSNLTDKSELGQKSPEQLEEDIEQTRAKISNQINALSDKLSPTELTERAKDTIQGTLQDTQDSAVRVIEGIADSLLKRSGRVGTGAVDFIKRYPLPTTLLGLGLAWLLMRGRDERP
jgi:hypothetical protein